jgi:hypothetical protein
MAADLSNPIINSPYDPPEAHFEIGPNGPTGQLLPGRRPSESYIPVPVSKKGRQAAQLALDFDITGERREQNSLINDIRREVERWRANNWNGVTPYTRKLLAHWAAQPPDRDEPVLFCQREAAETADAERQRASVRVGHIQRPHGQASPVRRGDEIIVADDEVPDHKGRSRVFLQPWQEVRPEDDCAAGYAWPG